MFVSCTYWLQKAGNRPDDYEDAYAVSPNGDRLAIADGATETSFAAEWARKLVQEWVISSIPSLDLAADGLGQWMQALQVAWSDGVNWDALPWYAVDKAAAGAFSTFLGVELIRDELAEPANVHGQVHTNELVRWRAVAVGDSCLFHIRNGCMLRAFPIECYEQFGNCPYLLSSIPASNSEMARYTHVADGALSAGDQIVLATDALAAWLLQAHGRGEKPWVSLSALKEIGEFVSFIDELRDTGQLRNDDVTLVISEYRAKSEDDGLENVPVQTGRST